MHPAIVKIANTENPSVQPVRSIISFPERRPSSKSVMLPIVVTAMFSKASRVKKAW